jgi:hypothetical protein
MKEFINKLIGRLEEYQGKIKLHFGNRGDFDFMEVDAVKEIVNELAEEYINTSTDTSSGWIACSERLPSEAGKYLITVKNLTGYWILDNNVFVCDYQFDDFIFQGWEDNAVIAWQPLPAPYKEGVTENGNS